MYKLNDDLAIVQTLDFLTPMVDDPYTFGLIAAANALSDLYTMAATPVTAMNIMAFPCALSPDIAGEIMKGGDEKIREAGAVLIGGHSVEDDVPKYGLAVTGTVHPEKLITNSGAKPGDALVLTKKIGVGIICSTVKDEIDKKSEEQVVTPTLFNEAVESMVRLNRRAAEVMGQAGVSACTDITGFGLLGHSLAMARASNARMVIEYSKIPVFDGADTLATLRPGRAILRNYSWVEGAVEFSSGLDEGKEMVMCDPQTSGGLLMAVSEKKADALVEEIREGGDEAAKIIGHVKGDEPGKIAVLP